ncbi:hypothetical protein [Yinghuangia sp. YIM S10712]|uniref:hypothetical protein n=1 Tax=Yinghuangia sp. YIM S10712 TaxID=3436930 RepID=UPI003F52C5CD
MVILLCKKCGHPITGNLSEGEPLRGPERPDGRDVALPRMAQGTYKFSVDGALLILHPDDVPGTASHPDSRRMNGCCGPHGQHGPNLVCSGCGAEIATKEADCWTDNLVAMMAAAVVQQQPGP